jgi:hypothetical protein
MNEQHHECWQNKSEGTLILGNRATCKTVIIKQMPWQQKSHYLLKSRRVEMI